MFGQFAQFQYGCYWAFLWVGEKPNTRWEHLESDLPAKIAQI